MKLVALCLLLVAFANATPDEAARVEVTKSSVPKRFTTSQGTVADRARLVAHLFKDYDKDVNPDNVTVKFGLALIDFAIAEKRGTVDTNFWLRYVWNDTRLAWKPEEYGGVSVLRFPAHKLWKPDITLYSSATPDKLIDCWDSQVLMYPKGEILWVPPCNGISYCPAMNLQKEPYGEHTCSLKFGSWTYDGYTMDLQFYGGKADIDTEDLRNTSGFEIVKTSAERVNKHYDCCEEPYPYIEFNFTVKRIPGEELENN